MALGVLVLGVPTATPESAGLSGSASRSSQKDRAIGGGQIVQGDCFFTFALNAYADDEASTAGVGGTFNLSLPKAAAVHCGEAARVGLLDAKVDCLIGVTSDPPGEAAFTAVVMAATGHFEGATAGERVTVDVFDDGTTSGDTIGVQVLSGGSACDGGDGGAENDVVLNGNIKVSD